MQVTYPSQINLFHILIVFPLLFYIGYYKGESPSWMFTTLMVAAVIGILYHAYRLYSR